MNSKQALELVWRVEATGRALRDAKWVEESEDIMHIARRLAYKVENMAGKEAKERVRNQTQLDLFNGKSE